MNTSLARVEIRGRVVRTLGLKENTSGTAGQFPLRKNVNTRDVLGPRLNESFIERGIIREGMLDTGLLQTEDVSSIADQQTKEPGFMLRRNDERTPEAVMTALIGRLGSEDLLGSVYGAEHNPVTASILLRYGAPSGLTGKLRSSTCIVLRNFRLDLSGLDFSGYDLKMEHLFQEADLFGTIFAGADLSHVSFWNADIRSADLSGTSLRCAHMYKADARGASFKGADLRNAHLDGIIFDPSTDFTHAYFNRREKRELRPAKWDKTGHILSRDWLGVISQDVKGFDTITWTGLTEYDKWNKKAQGRGGR